MTSRPRPPRARDRFRGEIAGIGSTSGMRVVVGHWRSSPLGAFTDVMVETPTGHRVLLAPTGDVADYVSETYTFDDVRIEDLTARVEPRSWRVRSTSLALELAVGRRPPLGLLLRSVPPPIATSPTWATVIAPVAALLLPGVRTVGEARAGRSEYYGATDLRLITHLSGSFDGADLGPLRDLDPPCRFGFSSTPRRPCVTTVVTTVEHG